MTAILAFVEVLWSIAFGSAVQLVKTLLLSIALICSLCFGIVLLVIMLMQR